MQDFEFTIEDGKLYMLQTRNGKRTGPAAVRIAVEMVEEGLIAKKEAVLRVAPQQLDQLLHPVFDPPSLKKLTQARHRHLRPRPAPPSAASRSPPTTPWRWRKSGPVILVRKETTPDDIHGMDVAKGILTAVGGKSSHAAVVARGMGRPCIVGAGAHRTSTSSKKLFTVTVGGKTITVKEGDWISLDGTTGDVYLGQANTIEPDPNSSLLRQVHGVGRRVPRQASACAPMRIFRATPKPPASSAPKASACAAPSTCSSPRIASRTCRR